MISINEYINSINSGKNNRNYTNSDSETKNSILQKNELKSEQKDSFENKDKKINRKTIKIGAFLMLSISALLVFLKRKNKFQTTQTITGSTFDLQDIGDNVISAMQRALDKLQTRKDDKALNSGIGFIGENIEKRERVLQAFLAKTEENGYKTVKIPTKDEATPDEIAHAINQAIKSAKDNFKQTGKRSILVIRDLDILGVDSSINTKYFEVNAAILDLENYKKNGIVWIWDANTAKGIDKSLLKRSPEKILVDK